MRKRLPLPYRFVKDPNNMETEFEEAQNAWKARIEEKMETFKELDFEGRKKLINEALQRTHPGKPVFSVYMVYFLWICRPVIMRDGSHDDLSIITV